ncbi:MAG: hypothetical protein AAGA99_19010 [Actinomycetota bacterium]
MSRALARARTVRAAMVAVADQLAPGAELLRDPGPRAAPRVAPALIAGALIGAPTDAAAVRRREVAATGVTAGQPGAARTAAPVAATVEVAAVAVGHRPAGAAVMVAVTADLVLAHEVVMIEVVMAALAALVAVVMIEVVMAALAALVAVVMIEVVMAAQAALVEVVMIEVVMAARAALVPVVTTAPGAAGVGVTTVVGPAIGAAPVIDGVMIGAGAGTTDARRTVAAGSTGVGTGVRSPGRARGSWATATIAGVPTRGGTSPHRSAPRSAGSTRAAPMVLRDDGPRSRRASPVSVRPSSSATSAV